MFSQAQRIWRRGIITKHVLTVTRQWPIYAGSQCLPHHLPCMKYQTSSSPNYYEILELKPSATKAQIKSAYYKLSKKHHPDRNKGSKVSQEKFAKVNEAYSILGKETLRKRYDRGILSHRDSMTREASYQAHTEYKHTPSQDDSLQYRFNKSETQRVFDDFLRKHYKESLRRNVQDKEEAEMLNRLYQDHQKQKQRSAEITVIGIIASCGLLWFMIKSGAFDYRTTKK